MRGTPSLTSNYCQVFRRDMGVDAEGRPVSTWTLVYAFSGRFGAVTSNREDVVGAQGQQVDAAVSTAALNPDVQVGDKLQVVGRDWAVVGIRVTGATTRILLSTDTTDMRPSEDSPAELPPPTEYPYGDRPYAASVASAAEEAAKDYADEAVAAAKVYADEAVAAAKEYAEEVGRIRVVNTQTGSFSLTEEDEDQLILLDGAGTVTVPPNTVANFPVGAQVHLVQINSGANSWNLAAGSGVTVQSNTGLIIKGQYDALTLVQIRLNEWVVVGSLSTGAGAEFTAALMLATQNTEAAIDTYPRHSIVSSTGVINNGEVRLTNFTPAVSRLVSGITVVTGSTAQVGASLVRLGLFTVNTTTNEITLVARTANDTTICATPNTAHARLFDTTGGFPASYQLVAGARYAVGLIVVGATTTPTLHTTGTGGAPLSLSPRMNGLLTGRTDLPTTPVTPSTAGSMPWFRLS